MWLLFVLVGRLFCLWCCCSCLLLVVSLGLGGVWGGVLVVVVAMMCHVRVLWLSSCWQWSVLLCNVYAVRR